MPKYRTSLFQKLGPRRKRNKNGWKRLNRKTSYTYVPGKRVYTKNDWKIKTTHRYFFKKGKWHRKSSTRYSRKLGDWDVKHKPGYYKVRVKR